jgi:hypothetical protein
MTRAGRRAGTESRCGNTLLQTAMGDCFGDAHRLPPRTVRAHALAGTEQLGLT